jgi:MoxR-like ATPase
MPIKETIDSILDLQPQWSATNSDAMRQRGILIRKELPALLRPFCGSVGLDVEGRDGTGSKTRVPWVRIFDPQFSAHATDGWYLVFLFVFDGSSVYLSLNQGTTKVVQRHFIPIEPAVLSSRAQQARNVISDAGMDTKGLLTSIVLKDPNWLGKGYEFGNLFALKYERGAIPPDDVIKADVMRLVPLLKCLYTTPETVKDKDAYLLTWNPEKWKWTDLDQEIDQLRSGSPVKDRWSALNQSIKPGDRVFLMRLGVEPKGIMGSGYVASAPYESDHYSGEAGKTQTSIDVQWDALLNPEVEKILPVSKLQDAMPDVHWFPQASGTALTQENHAKLEELWKSHLTGTSKRLYTVHDALTEVFLDKDFFEEVCELTLRRKNIVLQGPPGVGKTFVARRLAHVLLGSKDDSRLGWVQFHQAYSYEDFIQGFRPTADGFVLKAGTFYQFCTQAAANPGNIYVFVIDEINRGNLSRIFGEALSLLEDDKRGTLTVTLAYGPNTTDGSTGRSGMFTIPPNLLLIGLMNTADRSLAVVDYALRRRFAFVSLTPRFDHPRFDELLNAQGVSAGMREAIRHRVQSLNANIAADKRNLGHGFEIGHSFFCPKEKVTDEQRWYRSVIEYEIRPLLNEYWFDDPVKADRAIKGLLSEDSD